MANEEILTYLQDVLDAINDVQSCFTDFPDSFDLFERDMMRKCVVERKTEIMGEAINRIIHSYDNVQPAFLWSLVRRHIPQLKKDITRIITDYEELYNREQRITPGN